MRVFSATSMKAVMTAVLVAATMSGPSLAAQSGQGQAASGRDEDLEGVLEIQIEDGAAGATIHHFLDTGSEKVRLRGRPDGAEFQGLTSGSQVRVHGRRSDKSTLELGNNGGNVTTLALAAPNTFGVQRTAVVLVNFQDDASQPYTWSDAAYVTFGQVNDFYRENSYGQTGVTGDVFGWFTIPMSTATCDTNQLATLADQAAAKAGANLGNYTRIVYGFPRNACSWWGLGTVGGSPSRAWIKGTYSLKVVAHEMGHNFGNYHSNSMPCDSASCTLTSYGDDRDIMGLSGTGHMHAYQKERLGWLNYSASPAIQTVSSSGSYRISAYEGGSSPSALKILKSATSSDKTYYYVEARTPVGFDGPYAGVVMHTGNSSNGNTANQVDMDPVTATFDPQLDPGQSFSDAAASLTVTTISVDDSGAWVSITYAGQPCTTSTPAVTLSPGSSVTQPSVTSSYTMTVKNNDGSGCPSTGFGIGLVIPSGWGWSASQPQLSVAPGTTAGTTVYVTPPAGASGSTTVTATAARTESGPSGSASATLVVANALSVVLTATGGSQYQVSVTVKAGGAPASGAQVNFVLVDPKGGSSSFSGVTNSSGVATIKGRLKGKDPKGTYTVSVSVTSGNLTGSAAGSFVY